MVIEICDSEKQILVHNKFLEVFPAKEGTSFLLQTLELVVGSLNMEWVRGYIVRCRWWLMFYIFEAFLNIYPKPLNDQKKKKPAPNHF